MRAQLFERDLEDMAVGAGGDREFVFEVAQKKSAAFEVNLQLPALEHPSVLIAEDREQNLAAQAGFERMPIDVEIGGVSRAGPVLEHIGPPEVARLADAHVVGNEIEHLSHLRGRAAPRPRRHNPARDPIAALSLVVIGNVVAVQALRARLEIGRRISSR